MRPSCAGLGDKAWVLSQPSWRQTDYSRRVLTRDLMWYVAFVMAAATVPTIFALSRRHEAPRQFRVEDSPPQALQVAWALLFLAPQLYSFFTVVAPAYAYRTVLTFSFPFDYLFHVAFFS